MSKEMLYQKLRGDRLKIAWSPDTGNSVCTRGGAHGCRWPVSLRAEQRGRCRLPELPRSCPGQIQGLSATRRHPGSFLSFMPDWRLLPVVFSRVCVGSYAALRWQPASCRLPSRFQEHGATATRLSKLLRLRRLASQL